jgi:hypothetical protein
MKRTLILLAAVIMAVLIMCISCGSGGIIDTQIPTDENGVELDNDKSIVILNIRCNNDISRGFDTNFYFTFSYGDYKSGYCEVFDLNSYKQPFFYSVTNEYITIDTKELKNNNQKYDIKLYWYDRWLGKIVPIKDIYEYNSHTLEITKVEYEPTYDYPEELPKYVQFNIYFEWGKK